MEIWNKVTCLNVEPTTKCNASCPGCPRNNNGYGLKDNFELIDLDLDFFIDLVNKCNILKNIILCGNRGDPAAYKHLKDLLRLISFDNREFFVSIHTNGSLRSTAWWADLGSYKSNQLEVTFSIDGLEDTNHIYRQGTNFNKIIDNAKAYIDTGGHAAWKFLTFKHNQHQVEEARELSHKLGFSQFYTEMPYVTEARNWKTNEEYILDLPDEDNNSYDLVRTHIFENTTFSDNESYSDKINSNNYVDPVDCLHLQAVDDDDHCTLFISADNIIYPCCFWEDERKEVYDIETLNIAKEFSQGLYRKTCLEVCGVIK